MWFVLVKQVFQGCYLGREHAMVNIVPLPFNHIEKVCCCLEDMKVFQDIRNWKKSWLRKERPFSIPEVVLNSSVNLHCLGFASYLKSQHSVRCQSLQINRVSLNLPCLRQRNREQCYKLLMRHSSKEPCTENPSQVIASQC